MINDAIEWSKKNCFMLRVTLGDERVIIPDGYCFTPENTDAVMSGLWKKGARVGDTSYSPTWIREAEVIRWEPGH